MLSGTTGRSTSLRNDPSVLSHSDVGQPALGLLRPTVRSGYSPQHVVRHERQPEGAVEPVGRGAGDGVGRGTALGIQRRDEPLVGRGAAGPPRRR